jgi:hypothetical protein
MGVPVSDHGRCHLQGLGVRHRPADEISRRLEWRDRGPILFGLGSHKQALNHFELICERCAVGHGLVLALGVAGVAPCRHWPPTIAFIVAGLNARGWNCFRYLLVITRARLLKLGANLAKAPPLLALLGEISGTAGPPWGLGCERRRCRF